MKSKTSLKKFHSNGIKKSVIIKRPRKVVWAKISNIIGLPTWAIGVKETKFLSKTKRGLCAIRLITFDDGNQVEEHVVSWKNNESFSYIAVRGLALRGYHATFTITQYGKKSVRLTWESLFSSKKNAKK